MFHLPIGSKEATLSRILIIDDEVQVRNMLRRVLEEAGHAVFQASNGREGLALWRRERTSEKIFRATKDHLHERRREKGSV